MIRIVEIALFLAPLGLFAAWRLLAPGTELGARHLTVAAVVLALCLGTLVWLRMEEAEPPGSQYVPAQLRGTTVEPPTTRP